jgi:hypothetical protein
MTGPIMPPLRWRWARTVRRGEDVPVAGQPYTAPLPLGGVGPAASKQRRPMA